jgi:predicted TIM-barrel fold metal-dependent hydrolase
MSSRTGQAPPATSSGIREDWLAATVEPILEPDLPICDPHHHLWDFAAHRYMLPELLADTGSGHKVVSTVFIECGVFYRPDGPAEMRPIGETEFVNGVAAMAESGHYGPTKACAGIVGFADLSIGARAAEVLQAHVTAGNGRFRGIRQAGAWDADPVIGAHRTKQPPGLYRDSAFREGFAQLGPLGLTFDAWLYSPQLEDLIDLAQAYPDQPIVLDHVGGILGVGSYEGRRGQMFPEWERAIRSLATCESVHVKLGGLGMKRGGFGFHKREKAPDSTVLAETWRPYIETCIDAFGPERCMFESNFAVDKLSCSYAATWNAFKLLANGASAVEKAALFHDTAARFYAVP